jgi:NAD-dependent deacetylase
VIGNALGQIVGRAARPVILTGAGVSAESGVPTFRDAMTGLWTRYRPEELATPEAFEADPELVWRWYEWRRKRVIGARPNPGHRALADWQRRRPTLCLITQNVDGLHSEAGSDPVLELHGSLWRDRCNGCGRRTPARHPGPPEPPLCPSCESRLRPDVIWFGEALDAETMAAALAASRRCDLFMCVGTSSLVHPAADLPLVAVRAGATLVEINPQQTPLSALANYRIASLAGTALSRIVETAGLQGP